MRRRLCSIQLPKLLLHKIFRGSIVLTPVWKMGLPRGIVECFNEFEKNKEKDQCQLRLRAVGWFGKNCLDIPFQLPHNQNPFFPSNLVIQKVKPSLFFIFFSLLCIVYVSFSPKELEFFQF